MCSGETPGVVYVQLAYVILYLEGVDGLWRSSCFAHFYKMSSYEGAVLFRVSDFFL